MSPRSFFVAVLAIGSLVVSSAEARRYQIPIDPQLGGYVRSDIWMLRTLEQLEQASVGDTVIWPGFDTTVEVQVLSSIPRSSNRSREIVDLLSKFGGNSTKNVTFVRWKEKESGALICLVDSPTCRYKVTYFGLAGEEEWLEFLWILVDPLAQPGTNKPRVSLVDNQLDGETDHGYQDGITYDRQSATSIDILAWNSRLLQAEIDILGVLHTELAAMNALLTPTPAAPSNEGVDEPVSATGE